MQISEAQKEVRTIYNGGFFGQLTSAFVWLTSACLGTWVAPRPAILTLVIGGVFIFPITTTILKILGRPSSLPSSNPLKYLAMQVAFVLPLSMPLVAPVAAYHLNWFYPSMMILLGAHYLPFAFLYGMRSFIALSALLIISGLSIALYLPGIFCIGGWVTPIILFIFAIVGRIEAGRSST